MGHPENNVNVPLNDGLSSALVLDGDTGEQAHLVLIRIIMKQYEIMIGWKKSRENEVLLIERNVNENCIPNFCSKMCTALQSKTFVTNAASRWFEGRVFWFEAEGSSYALRPVSECGRP
jgi:hypothetical protein